MKFFAKQADPLKFSKYIAVRDAYRFRVGDYRIFFHTENNVIYIRTIERRDKAYD